MINWGMIILLWVESIILAWGTSAVVKQEKQDMMELRARINAIEATIEPLAYDSVDYDNRLAKIEGKKRMIEEESDDGK